MISDLTPYQLAVDQAHAYLTRDLQPMSDEALRWTLTGLLALGPDELDILTAWLRGNEHRIAAGEDGLGMLASVFTRIVGREPKAEPKEQR